MQMTGNGDCELGFVWLCVFNDDNNVNDAVGVFVCDPRK